MDDPNCDLEMLYNTYRQFRFINVLLSRSKVIYGDWIKPAMSEQDRSYSLLDIGFGGGDIPLAIAQWAKTDGYKLRITGIDIDPRAVDYVNTLAWPENLYFRLASVQELVENGERFDFVISNHMLHHLNSAEFLEMLNSAALLSRRYAIFMDLERSDLAYCLFAIFALPVSWKSFIRHDGLVSLRRSYTFEELKRLTPSGWLVDRVFPFRLLLIRKGDSQP
ncbi:MAG: methyltransferase domain-containing protein [Gammaproteobacteria bacterium]|nr:methyltransferase domain-containing protein [Gammaproteobacteria bacterium]